MKARHEFQSEKEWFDYLRIYFAAMATECDATKWGDKIIEEIMGYPVPKVTNGGKYYFEYMAEAEGKMRAIKADKLIEALNKTE